MKTWPAIDRRRTLALAAGLGVAALATVAAVSGAAQSPPLTTMVTVEGSSSAIVTPQKATVTVGAVVDGPTAGQAVAALGKVANAVVQAVEQTGIAAASIQTTGLNVYPRYPAAGPNAPPPAPAGYQASEQFAVTAPLDQVGTVIDAATKAGANQVQGIQLVAPPTAYRAAYAQALAQAYGRAQALAAAAHLKVAGVVSIDTVPGATPVREAPMPVVNGPASVPVLPGGVTQTVTLVVQYRLSR